MSSSHKVVYAAVAANAAIAITKFIAGAISGSSAMLSEAIHSVVDTGNEGLLLLGLYRSHLPPDAQHPFGHGKELYFWSLIVAIMLFCVGGGMAVYEGITHILHSEPLGDARWAYGVLLVAALFECISFTIAVRELRCRRGPANLLRKIRVSKDPSVFTVFFEDSAALTGLAVAFVGVFLSQHYRNRVFDGAASIVVGLILATVALLLARETRDLLIGESATEPTLANITDIVRSDPAVAETHPPLTMHLAPREVLLNLEVQFKPELSAADQVAAVTRLEDAIRRQHPEMTRIFIEARAFLQMSA